MNEIDKRRTEWLALEHALGVVEGMREEYPLDRELNRACYQLQVLVDKAEARHFELATRLERPDEVVV
jgi:hypothetical protein